MLWVLIGAGDKGSFEEWLAMSNPMVAFDKVEVPVLVLNAMDDPVSLKVSCQTHQT